jgi:hypothetical protein
MPKSTWSDGDMISSWREKPKMELGTALPTVLLWAEKWKPSDTESESSGGSSDATSRAGVRRPTPATIAERMFRGTRLQSAGTQGTCGRANCPRVGTGRSGGRFREQRQPNELVTGHAVQRLQHPRIADPCRLDERPTSPDSTRARNDLDSAFFSMAENSHSIESPAPTPVTVQRRPAGQRWRNFFLDRTDANAAKSRHPSSGDLDEGTRFCRRSDCAVGL